MVGDQLRPYRLCFQAWIVCRVVVLAKRLLATGLTASVTIKPAAVKTASQPSKPVVKAASKLVGAKEKDESQLWVVHGVQYDLAGYIDRHPGGKEALLLGRGRDCSALFESYHPFTDKHRYVLLRRFVETLCLAVAYGVP